jgi:hypothetical protein
MQATQQQPTFSNHPGLPESWATEWGKDRFGAFARLHVGGVMGATPYQLWVSAKSYGTLVTFV